MTEPTAVATDPIPGSLAEPVSKPEPPRAWRDHNGQIWVESHGKLFLAGWTHGIDVIHPEDGDHRATMTELREPSA